MGIFDIFKTRQKTIPEEAQRTFDGPTFYYHADDFLQVQIVPNSSPERLLEETIKAGNFAQEHFDGIGFTDLYVRDNQNIPKLNQRAIAPSDFEKAFEFLEFERIPQVLTGYGENHRELHSNCIAFCKGYSTILYDFKDDILQNVWLQNHWGIDKEKLSSCLKNFGTKWQLLLQDWNLDETIDLRSKQSIDKIICSLIMKHNKICV